MGHECRTWYLPRPCRCMEPDPLSEERKQFAADLISEMYATPSSEETFKEVLERLRNQREVES